VRTLRAALLLLSVCACAHDARAFVEAPSPSLRLTAEIVSRRYCAGATAGILELQLSPRNE